MKQTMVRILSLASLGLALALIALPAVAQSAGNSAKAKAVGEKGDEPRINQLIADWGMAYQKHDVAVLQRVLADEYFGTDANGTVYRKKDEVALVKSGQVEFISNEMLSPMEVKTYGGTAVLHSHSRFHATVKGEDYAGEFRATIVLVKRGGRWQAVSWQHTRVRGSR